MNVGSVASIVGFFVLFWGIRRIRVGCFQEMVLATETDDDARLSYNVNCSPATRLYLFTSFSSLRAKGVEWVNASDQAFSNYSMGHLNTHGLSPKALSSGCCSDGRRSPPTKVDLPTAINKAEAVPRCGLQGKIGWRYCRKALAK